MQGVVVTGTNPKILLFYAAFFPQFIDPAAPAVLQMTVLCVTFLVIAASITAAYGIVAGQARRLFEGRRRAIVRNRITGSILVGAGVGLALAKRS